MPVYTNLIHASKSKMVLVQSRYFTTALLYQNQTDLSRQLINLLCCACKLVLSAHSMVLYHEMHLAHQWRKAYHFNSLKERKITVEHTCFKADYSFCPQVQPLF